MSQQAEEGAKVQPQIAQQLSFVIKIQTKNPTVVTVINDLLDELTNLGALDGFLIEKESV